MDENYQRFLREFANCINTPEENTSAQNSQSPPNHPYSTQFPIYPLVQNFQQPPYPMPSSEYWLNMSNSYMMSSSRYGYSNSQVSGSNLQTIDIPMQKEPKTLTHVPKTQIFEHESPIDLSNLDKGDLGDEEKKKRSSWSRGEDELLAKSYVTISDNPISGNDQIADAFWVRVTKYYNENRHSNHSRRIVSVIRSHWHNTIQKKVYHFNEDYNSVYGVYRHGCNNEDILRLAYEKYRDRNNGSFNLEHVWRIIKDRPMFAPQSVDHTVCTKKSRILEFGASNTSSTQGESIDLDANEEDASSVGQKAAKRKSKNKGKIHAEDMKINMNTMCEQLNGYKLVKQAELDLMKKKLEVEEMKAKAKLAKSEAQNRKMMLKEYEIFTKDTLQMSDEQRMIHERLCQEIRERWNF